ncbi:hypothetical protein M407DRAFT_32725 [Tulasnella calospora MUT 4182]|uniref:DUF7918 domain-containing protein n=1 Tax=Tulasnella calospora MUT 4182 TaxID=1051891 RepID=A0A0C3Q3H1_9AGAM|nr:hypothetical protein M407DRAFT_32725 [Tulasnella calospora MUT 4182]
MSTERRITKLTFRGFWARIRIGDRPLTIYKPCYDKKTKTASGWIASKPGEEYSVCWKKNDVTEYAAHGKVYIDGPRRRGNMYVRGRDTGWVVERGVRTAVDKERPFIFSELTTTDDDNALDQNIPTEPGTIIFKVFRVKVTSGPREWKGTPSDPFSTQVHEKSKKAGAHITKIGDERKAVAVGTPRDTKPFTEADRSPYVIFVLRYRPEAILRARGFMPQSLDQSQGRANDGGDKGDNDEVQAEAEIAALRAALQVTVASLSKRKGAKLEDVEADLARKRRKVKQEEVIDVDLYFIPGEVIDLTDL